MKYIVLTLFSAISLALIIIIGFLLYKQIREYIERERWDDAVYVLLTTLCVLIVFTLVFSTTFALVGLSFS